MAYGIVGAVVGDYIASPLVYSLGVVALGLITHRVLTWLCPTKNNGNFYHAEREDGLLYDMILPSRCIKRRVVNFRGRWHTSVASIVSPPSSPHWRPVLVFANRKSGSNQGAEILDQCRRLLNPIQVHDLSSKPPSSTLELCQLLPDIQFQILVCGGDGSVNWVLTEIDRLKLITPPTIAVLPLGTGNDLANMLGWGASYDDNDSIENFLAELRYGIQTPVDRWDIKIKPLKRYLSWKTKNISMTNYFSIGCDALISLNFHKQRQKKPGLFSKRSLNRLFYVGYGAIDVLEQHCKNLDQSIELWLDGEKVELPELEGLIFLNISSWGGGCKIWDNMLEGDLQWENSNPGDGVIEVMGVSSSFHMAQIQVQLAEPIRLGQVKSASIIVHTKVPMQSDGEPFEQNPCKIEISFRKTITMLTRNLNNTSSDNEEVLVLETD